MFSRLRDANDQNIEKEHCQNVLFVDLRNVHNKSGIIDSWQCYNKTF